MKGKRPTSTPLPDRTHDRGTLHAAKRRKVRRKVIHQTHHMLKQEHDANELEEILPAYQQSSLINGKFGSKAIVKFLCSSLVDTNVYSLLDVGSINGMMFDGLHHIAVDAIDLNPQSSRVRKQDFLAMSHHIKYDVVALSLVLNFPPSPIDRGRMLVQAKSLLTHGALLLLVLPLACVQNSRCLDHNVLVSICRCLGLSLKHHQFTKRLAMYLFRNDTVTDTPDYGSFCRRAIVNDGPGRNNFAILLPRR